MGYVEETGAAQHYRDARISPIYEGTNGIQAADLVGRKLGLEGGAVLDRLLADIRADGGAAVQRLLGSIDHVLGWMRSEDATPDDRMAGAYPLLTMLSVAVCAWLLERQEDEADRELRSGEGDELFLRRKLAAIRYYLEIVVSEALGQQPAATMGATLYDSVPDEAYAAG